MNYLRTGLALLLIAAAGWGAPTPLLPGSRVQALSGAFTGLADDANAIFYNLAGITFQKYLSSDFSLWRTDDGKLGGASVMYINPSTANHTMAGLGWTGTGITGATAKERAGAFIIPTVYIPAKNFPLGLGLKIVYDRNSSGKLIWHGAFDAGTMLMFGRSLRIGAAVRNFLRTGLDAFPTTVALGASLKSGSVLKLVVDGEANSIDEVRKGEGIYAAGVELRPVDYAILQGGVRNVEDIWYYSMGAEISQSSGGSGIGIAYLFPSDAFSHGWFSFGFTYTIR
jgi:hypothetical protein